MNLLVDLLDFVRKNVRISHSIMLYFLGAADPTVIYYQTEAACIKWNHKYKDGKKCEECGYVSNKEANKVKQTWYGPWMHQCTHEDCNHLQDLEKDSHKEALLKIGICRAFGAHYVGPMCFFPLIRDRLSNTGSKPKMTG